MFDLRLLRNREELGVDQSPTNRMISHLNVDRVSSQPAQRLFRIEALCEESGQ